MEHLGDQASRKLINALCKRLNLDRSIPTKGRTLTQNPGSLLALRQVGACSRICGSSPLSRVWVQAREQWSCSQSVPQQCLVNAGLSSVAHAKSALPSLIGWQRTQSPVGKVDGDVLASAIEYENLFDGDRKCVAE